MRVRSSCFGKFSPEFGLEERGSVALEEFRCTEFVGGTAVGAFSGDDWAASPTVIMSEKGKRWKIDMGFPPCSRL
jgi:hypothetical protein